MKSKGIVFDLDDTLYSEADYVASGFGCVAEFVQKNFAVKDVLPTLYELFYKSRQGVFDRLIQLFGLDVDVKQLHQIYINHMPLISVYADVLPAFNKIRECGYKLGLITDGRVVQQKNKIKALGIEKCFDYIVLTQEHMCSKPDCLPFELMQRELGLEFLDMVYIGDNPKKDFFVSSIYPITTIQVLREGFYGGDEFYMGVKPNKVVRGLDEIEWERL